ncbi:hypothetical protein [Ferrimonas balearica]|uniref:hypothetical protein n=1 Tax=Ferrimonas balearica TaxID=44012 RepID=UPI001C99FA17|nr:hypothetical protein [Ferrimonas balearica]MBY5992275.1 DUF2607 family protein [Ferrimonas balearica]
MTSSLRAFALLMALWLLAISLAAPAHELSHVHDEVTLSEQCDFFAHQSQLQQLLSHADVALPSLAPEPWSGPVRPEASPRLPQRLYGARAPPVDPRV